MNKTNDESQVESIRITDPFEQSSGGSSKGSGTAEDIGDLELVPQLRMIFADTASLSDVINYLMDSCRLSHSRAERIGREVLGLDDPELE